MDNDPIQDEDVRRIRAACEQLCEHYDTVQIFVTRHEPTDGGTMHSQWGAGNLFAREGQVRDWMIKNEEAARLKIRRAAA